MGWRLFPRRDKGPPDGETLHALPQGNGHGTVEGTEDRIGQSPKERRCQKS